LAALLAIIPRTMGYWEQRRGALSDGMKQTSAPECNTSRALTPRETIAVTSG
jgi:hypothetical protein